MNNERNQSVDWYRNNQEFEFVSLKLGRYRDTWKFQNKTTKEIVNILDWHEDDDFGYTSAAELARDKG